MQNTVVQLREVVSLITKGTTPTTIGYPFVKEGINFVKAESISENFNFNVKKFEYITKECDDVLQRSRLKEDDLLFSIAGVIGKVALVTKTILPANTNQALAILRPIKEKVNPRYLAYILSSSIISNQCLVKKNGVAQVNISLKNIGDFIIPLPPIEEQRAIAEKLDNVSQLVDKRKEQLQQLDQLVKSQFIDMFGDPKQNPKGWEQTLLKNVAIGKLSYGSGASAIEYDGQTRYIRITDITETGGLIEDAKSPNVFDEKYLLNSGDILFARSGATVGKTFCYNSNMGRCIFAGYLIRFVPNTDKVLPEYIFNYTKTEHYANFVKDCQRAVAQPNINAQEYGNLIICVPPMELQKQFAEFVERVDKLKEKVNNSLTQLNLLKQSLMQQYFN